MEINEVQDVTYVDILEVHTDRIIWILGCQSRYDDMLFVMFNGKMIDGKSVLAIDNV